MTRFSRMTLATAAAVSAMALLALQIVGGMEYTEGQTLYVRSSMIAAMVAVAFLPLYIHAAWHVGKVLAVVLFSAFIFLLIYSLPASIGRISEGKEVKAIAATDAQVIQARLGQIATTLQTAEPAAHAACAKDLRGKPGDVCIHRTAVVKASLAEQRRLKADLKAIGVSDRAGDVSSAQVAWALTWAGIQPEEVRRATGIAFPVGLELAIFSLVWLVAKLATGPSSPPSSGGQQVRRPTLPPEEELKKLRELVNPTIEQSTASAMAGEADWKQNWNDLGFRPRAQAGELLIGGKKEKVLSFLQNSSNSSTIDQQETAMSPVTEASFDIPALSLSQITQLAGKLAGRAIPRQATKAAAMRRLEAEIDGNIATAKVSQVKQALAKAQHFGSAEEIIDKEMSPVAQAVSWGKKPPAKKAEAFVKAPVVKDDFDATEEDSSELEEEKVNGIRGRKSSLLGKTIKPKVDANPRRQNTWGFRSMAIILSKPGLTTEEFVAAGGRLKDLIWDIKCKHVEVK